MKFLLIAALITLSTSTLEGKPTRNEEWRLFLARHNKSYNAGEEVTRRAIWEVRKNEIDQHNIRADQGLESYYISDNKFADMTDDELRSYKNTIVTEINAPVFEGLSEEERKVLASSVDYSTDPCMPAPKDQGQCGSCWSFSATNPIEFQQCKKNGNNVAVHNSEQQLVDCSSAFGNGGCNGGMFTAAWEYLIAGGGQESSQSYPYKAKDGRCAFDKTKVVSKVASFHKVKRLDEAALADAVASFGPVSVAIQATNKFQLYTHGIYDDPSCPHDGFTANHAVVAVGYGHDAASGKDYWIVRNSWGPGWGESGYVRMKRGVNMCNIAMDTAYPTIA